jgi:hydroxymethylpyrimidine pyrophosphatase-like HAD family hydrolase
MRYRALATDFDGTLAFDGKVEDLTLAALQRARAAGLKLVMVTGRELSDLFNTFPHSQLFDRVVAENGALVFDPAAKTTKILSPPPPSQLVRRLAERQIPFSAGHSIVATVEPYEASVLEAIRDLGLEWHVIFNKGSVMALPSNITKATGLEPALAELGLSAAETVGIGDAENDHAFLQACGLGVAVANALPALKDTADLVTDGARGAGVMEILDRILRDDLPARPSGGRPAQVARP